MDQFETLTPSDNIDDRPVDISDILSTKTRHRLIDKVLPFSKEMYCKKNKEVLISGMESSGFYYVKTGAVEVSYPSKDTRIVVALIGEGSFFGESGFFDNTSRIRDIRAVEDASIHVFDHETLNELQTKCPHLFGQFMMVMSFSISQKFRRILDERQPLTTYASSLSTGRPTVSPHEHVAYDFLKHPEGIKAQKHIDHFFKSRVFDFSCQLQKDVSPEIPQEIIRQGEDLFYDFHALMNDINTLPFEEDHKTSLWKYLFKEAFPYIMRSRFAERSYFKPKGYAGDFMTIEMLYRNSPEGDGKLGTLMDQWCLNSPAAQAVRQRRRLLTEEIKTRSEALLNSGKTVSIMNLACGPCRELADFIKTRPDDDAIRSICVDIDPDALEYAHGVFGEFEHKASVSFMRANLIKWCMGRVDHDFKGQDIIYSSGLMDYLDDTLFQAMIQRCSEQLNPGGVLILGNFSHKNPIRMFMDHILDWKLIYRSEEDLLTLHDDTLFKGHVHVISEKQGINLFSVAQKP